MTIPKWLKNRYKFLWEAFRDTPFNFDNAAKILKDQSHTDKDQSNVILSELKKRGMLEVDSDPEDARKKIYRLHSMEKKLAELIPADKTQLTRGDLESLLKGAADLIRTRVDYSFILVLLFYKRISDKWEMEFEQTRKEVLADGLNEKEAREEAKNSTYHDFDIPEGHLWEDIRKDTARIPENFSRAMKLLAERNTELKDVFENVDFVQFTSNRENAEILRQLVELFSARPLNHVSPDILGDAYEWLLKYFAPQKAKEGEVYTSREVIALIVDMLEPKPGESVYDPACGSGGMLIISYQHAAKNHGKKGAEKIFLFGQEANHKTLALSKMNLNIHDIRNAQLSLGDTLLYPKFKEGEKIKKFDIVIANPPWNQDGYDEEILKKGEFWRERFKFGFTPKQSADWSWIQHMLTSAKEDTGRVGVVIDNGCLFRGGKEKAIRTGVLNADLIESIILLPEKLFYNTGAPGAIIIFNKKKPKARKGKVLFINASKDFQQNPEVRKLNQLGPEHIKKIAGAYRGFKEIEGFSRIVDIEKIKDNDFNLNVTLYVFPEEKTEEIDTAKEWGDLKKIEKDLVEIEAKIEGFLKEIN